ncbi:lamin tail domain-containing protein [Winogradskyella sp. MIT101101]|uniref:lamin tail domain-containing protein n=1 Tax=Winogradskyella sp. MIT101101 TaxID=3098297 RepID=UPI00399B3950
MRHFYTFLVAILFTSFGFGQIISQYVETNSGTTPKGIEIWNNTGSDIIFSGSNNLQISQGTNGGACSAIASTNTTSGTLVAGEVWIIGTSDIISYVTTNGSDVSGTTTYNFGFNGDDALEVRLGGTLIDMFGTCGTDPGSAWSGSGVSTANQNIELLNSVTTGNTGGFTDPSTRFSTVSTTPATLPAGLAGFGNAPSAPSANPSIGFDSPTSTENETNTTFTSSNIPITVSNYDGNQIDIDVNVTGGTAEAGDYTFTSPTSLSFTADGTQNITIDINADADFDDETVELTITETSSVTGLVISQATHTVTILDDDTPPLPNIVINEILADPNGTDANGDGFDDATEDEFVELVNNDITAVDITGYTLSDALGVKHVFGSIVLPAGGSVVVFGGGTPTGISGASEIASTGALQLNNGGDTVTLEDTSSNVIASYTYGSEGGDDQSLGRSEDLFGGFVQHLSIDANPVAASPGLHNRAGVAFSTPTWKGFVDTDWSNSANWGSGSVPGAGDDIVILSVNNIATIGSSITVNSVTTNPGANLIVSSGGTLNASNVTLRSTSSSFSSLISDGSINSSIAYDRFVNEVGTGATGTGGNDLISLPLFPSGGLTFDTFLTLGSPTNATKLASQTTIATTYAFGPYNNGAPVPDYENYDSNSTDALVVAKGYRVATTTGEALTFTGDALQANQTIMLTNPVAGGSQWNLIGNPFASYVDAQAWLSTNGAILDPTAIAIYGYNSGTYSGSDQTIGNFTIINGTSNNTLNIAPGQAFFVAADTGDISGNAGTVVFAGNSGFPADMRTTTGDDDFIEGRNSINHHLKLKLNGTTSETTSFYFNDHSTRGLDPGFDAATLDAFTSEHLLYSHLVEDNTGRSMAINSLSLEDMLDVTIPLGVNSNQGEEITFSIDTSTLPNGIDVYLDDNVANTSTLLNSSDYTVTPSVDLNGTGRFYLRLGDSALSVPTAIFDQIDIFTNRTEKTVVISGELPESSVAHIYDLQGRQVLSTALDTALRTQRINISDLSTGVYVVKVSNNTASKSQKVILN